MLMAHGGSPDPAAIAAAFATLESLCANPSLADLHAALRRCTRELSLGVYCCKEWFGFNTGNNAVPFFEILKDAGQQLAQARAALGAQRSANSQLQAQVTCGMRWQDNNARVTRAAQASDSTAMRQEVKRLKDQLQLQTKEITQLITRQMRRDRVHR